MLELKNRSAQELIVLSAAAICMLGQVPFAFIRLAMGDWPVALVDATGALLCGLAFYQVYRHRRARIFGAIMSVAAVGGVLFIIYRHGVQDVHFLYPVLFITFFLLQPREAIALSVVAIAVVGMMLNSSLQSFYLLKICISILGCAAFAYAFASLRNHQSEKLLLLSTRDALTNVLNRRSLNEKLIEFVQQSKRHESEAALIILDLDKFKQINDAHGHAAGDAVLIRVASAIQQRIRVTDSLYRYGGDEFVVFVADSNLQQAVGLAEDLRTRVEATEAMEGSNLSISLGVAVFDPDLTPEQWLNSADEALFSAKRAGRNQVATEMVAQ